VPSSLASVPSDLLQQRVPETSQLIWTIFCSTLAVIGVACFVTAARRQRSAWPIIICLSGFLAFMCEPVYDNAFHIWFPQQGHPWTLYRAFGVTEMAWVPITYLFCYGGLTLFVMERIRAGAGTASVLRLGLVLALTYEVFEVIAIQLDLWHYWGPKPLNVFGHPAWVSLGNATIPILAAVAFLWLERVLDGPRRWLALPVIPFVFSAVSFGTSVPGIVALNIKDTTDTLVWIGALLSIAADVAVVRLALGLVPPVREGAALRAAAAAPEARPPQRVGAVLGGFHDERA
jgi:hypothetical protein